MESRSWSVHEFRYFSMGGTPHYRLVKDGERTSYDAPPFASPANDRTMAAVPPPPHEFTCEPKCAISDLLAHLIQSTHRKLAVADMEEDTVRVASFANRSSFGRDSSITRSRHESPPRRDVGNYGPQQSLPAQALPVSSATSRTEYQMAGRKRPGGNATATPPSNRWTSRCDPQRVKDAAPPIQPPTTRSTPTQPHRADKAIPTIPSEAANSPPFRARKHTKTSKTSKTFRIISWTLGFGVLLVSVLATIHDFERTTFHVTKISHTSPQSSGH